MVASVVLQHLQRTCHLKLLGIFQLNFIYSLQARGGGGGWRGRKLYIFGPGHITKKATKPMVKTLKNSSWWIALKLGM